MNHQTQNQTIEQLQRALTRAGQRVRDLEEAPQSDEFLDIVRIAYGVDPDATSYHLHKLGLGHVVAGLSIGRELSIRDAINATGLGRQSTLPFGSR